MPPSPPPPVSAPVSAPSGDPITWEVELTCEQRAVLIVTGPADATPEQLRTLALQRLDASGGAEWETVVADTHARPVTGGSGAR